MSAFKYLGIIFVVFFTPQPTSAQEAKQIAISNINVLPMTTETVLPDQTVLISDGKICEIGTTGTVTIPENFETYDGLGQYLIPGLTDMHVHLRHADQSSLMNYLHAGITLIREMNGRPFLLEWRDKLVKGDMIGPRMIVASPTIGNFSSPKDGYPTPETPDAAREAVIRFHQEGYDLIKVYSFLNADVYYSIIQTAREFDLPVAGHIPLTITLEDALESKIDSIEHLTSYFDYIATPKGIEIDVESFSGIFFGAPIDETKLRKASQLTAASGVWNTPTLFWFSQNNPFSGSRDAWAQTCPSSKRMGPLSVFSNGVFGSPSVLV